ncbi:MAG: hypothetical protein ACREYD_03455 [Casimicrobiaceae bacterium]
MQTVTRHVDSWSWVVIAVTFVLFLLALFLKGLSHDLLLEAGVFLISVKLILMERRRYRSGQEVGRDSCHLGAPRAMSGEQA